MKILQVVHAFPPYNTAGVEVYTYNLCRELTSKHEVYVFHRVCHPRRKEYALNYGEEGKIKVYSINNTFKHCNSFAGLYRNSQIAQTFSNVLDAISPDIVHIQDLHFLSTDIIREIKARDIPIVYTLHDYWLICPQWNFLRNKSQPCSGDNEADCVECLKDWLLIGRGPKFIYRMLKYVVPAPLLRYLKSLYVASSPKRLDKERLLSLIRERKDCMRSISGLIDIFISPSQFMRSRFTEFGIAKEKCLFIPHGVRAFKVKDGHPDLKNGITFGFIGTLLPAKGVHLLIEAFREIKSENTRLNIYGKLYPYVGFEDYPAYLRGLARGKRIYFKGGFDNEELGRIFSEFDVLVVPSLWMENSPLVIQEAFRARVPVIASRIGGIPELVYHGKNGFLFNPADVQDLKSKMELIIEKPEIIQELKKNISPPKDMNKHAAEIEDVYARIIKTVRSS